MYKFISWNVNGLRAICGKGFADIFEELDADFVCLQETKMQAGQLDLEFMGYQSYWNYVTLGTTFQSTFLPLATRASCLACCLAKRFSSFSLLTREAKYLLTAALMLELKV